MMPLTVVKIGGNVLASPAATAAFASAFAAMEGLKILVHGGGKEATLLARQLGIEPVMVEGRRITDDAMLEVATMVYAGLVNKRLVAALQTRHCNALGLCGADAHVITATRRSPKPIDFGNVGDLSAESVDAGQLLNFVEQGLTPVICAIEGDGQGGLLNCNADSVASAVAVAMAALTPTRLCFCFEMPGVLAIPSDPASVIPHISAADFITLKANGTVAGGMVPKLEGAFKAISQGVQSVVIKAATSLDDPTAGTTIC